MSDIEAIQQVLNTYSFHASMGELEAMVDTFADDGVWEIPGIGAKFEGKAQILAGAGAIVGAIEYIVQLNSPAVIEVNGDRASAKTIIRECGKYAGKQVCLEILGAYTDELVRTPAGWRFARRLFAVRGMHDFAIAPPSLHD